MQYCMVVVGVAAALLAYALSLAVPRGGRSVRAVPGAAVPRCRVAVLALLQSAMFTFTQWGQARQPSLALVQVSLNFRLQLHSCRCPMYLKHVV